MLNSGSGTENEVIHLVRMDTGEKYTYKLHTIRIGSIARTIYESIRR